MATPDEIKAQAEGIQNSEKLLDLSNQLNNSITERKKLLKSITAEEQLYFTTIKQQQKLSQEVAANAEKYLGYQIKSKDLAKQIKASEDNIAKSKKTFEKIQDNVTKQYQDAVKANSKLIEQINAETKLNFNFNANLDRTLKIYNDLKTKKEQNGNVTYRELAAARRKYLLAREEVSVSDKVLKNLQENQQKQEGIAKTAAEVIKNGKETLDSQEKELAFLKENEKIRKRIEKSTGLLGAFTKSLSKIPGIGPYLNADEAITEMEKLAATIEEAGGKSTSFANRLKIGLKGASTLAKGFYDNIKSPEAIFSFFIKAALTANTQTVQLGKSLGTNAKNFRENLVGVESSSTNINVNTKNLVEAFGELVTATGLVSNFSADALETQIMLTKQFGLTADEAAGIFKFSQLTGKSSKSVNDAMVGAFVATRNSLKVGVPFKAAIAEAAKVSGALASNFQNNPARITAAVVQAKALGTTLEQTAKQGESLLNFESSIENELKAELLTGKQLNLERARAAALAGDQVTLAEELAKNVGSIEEFDRMNVLQKKALAESVGLTTDELAKQLQNQKLAQETGKSLAQITKEQALDEQKRQDIQTQFVASIDKLKSLIGNLVSGPLGTMLDILVKMLNVVNLILQPFTLLASFIKESTAASSIFLGTLGAIYAVKNKTFLIDKAQVAIEGVKKAYNATEIGQLGIIQSIKSKGFFKTLAEAAMTAFKAVAGVPFIGPVLGAAAAATAVGLGVKLYSKGDDVVSQGYGKRVLSTPEGSIALNDKDTIVAGTDLGGGNQSISGPTIDLSPMIAAINEVKASVDNLMNRPVVINMDSKQVGSNLVQGSYKLA